MRKLYKAGLCSILLAALITQTVITNKSALKANAKEINNKKETKRKPNIINIVLDDFGWSDTTLNGSEFYETPNMEALAETGVRFTNSYSGSNLCSPSRAMMLTGRYGTRFGMTRLCSPNEEAYQTGINPQTMVPYKYPFNNENYLMEPEPAFLPDSELTIAEQLKTVGYTTAHIGKWHLGDPTRGTGPLDQGFDINIGGYHMGQPRSYFSPYNNPYLPDGPKGEYLSDRLGDEAVKFIKEHKDEPFFLNFSQYAVHTPLQSKQDKTNKYLEKTPSNGQDNAVYAGVIESADEAIGKIVKAVKDLNLEEDTLLVVTSDNGGLHYWNVTSNAPLRKGKCFNYEGGIRIPTIISWKGHIEENTVNDTPINQIDFFPTFSEVAGLDLPTDRKIDGVSLLPMLTEGTPIERESLFWYNPHFNPDTKLVLNENPYKPKGKGDDEAVPSAAVRQGDYKLIKNFAPPTYANSVEYELYNLKEDIGETINLADQHPEMVKKMAKAIDDWLKDTNAVQPVNVTKKEEVGEDITKIDQSNLSAVATSEATDTGAANVLDADNQTIWQSQLSQSLPQSITIDLKSTYRINKLSYQPRLTGTDGNITEYKIYTSIDGVNYNHRVSGTWNHDTSLKFADFPAVDAQYIKLRAVAGSNQKASAAEINVFEAMEVDHYDKTSVKTIVGTAPILPKEIGVTYKNGKKAKVSVTWESDTAENYEKVGTYTLSGTLTDSLKKVEAEISVEKAIDETSVTPINYGDFDGLITKYKELPNHPNISLSNEFSIDLDVKLNGVDGNWQTLISQTDGDGKGFQMNITPEGYISVHANDAITPMNLSHPWISMQSKIKLEKGEWNHLRLSFSADYHKAMLYINDMIAAESVVDKAIDTVELPISLGSKDTENHGFNGLLKDIKIYPAFLMKSNTKAITTLDQIMVKGTALEGFDMNTKEYKIYMPDTIISTPTVSATPTDKSAKVSVSPSVRIPGAVTITVTGTDKTTTLYSLQFAYKTAKLDGDFNNDGKINLSDLGIASKAYGKVSEENDLNGNGKIDDYEIDYIMDEIFK